MRPTSVFRFAAGASFVKTLSAPTLTAMPAVFSSFSTPPMPSISIPSCSSLSARAPAPSETTARRSSVSAAASSIISPPTDSPIPPMRPGSTSGRCCRKRIAALMSRSPPHPKAFG